MQVLTTFLLIVLGKVINVIHPLVLKMVIDWLTLGQTGYFLVIAYCIIKFAGEIVNNMREVTFAAVSANAEVFIADKVYNHVQSQSLEFHLNRETGKILRICQRGSSSFSSILWTTMFSIGPLFLELLFVIIIVAYLFPWYFFIVILVSIIAYLVDTFLVTEWRAKYFKNMNIKD